MFSHRRLIHSSTPFRFLTVWDESLVSDSGGVNIPVLDGPKSFVVVVVAGSADTDAATEGVGDEDELELGGVGHWLWWHVPSSSSSFSSSSA